MNESRRERERTELVQRELESRTFWYCTHNGVGGGFHVMRPRMCDTTKQGHATCGPRVRPKGEG